MSRSLKVRSVVVFAALAAVVACAFAPAALAERPQPLIDFPGDRTRGSDAGHFDLPNAIAVSPVTGDVYVVDDLNHRVSVFTAWGQFVRAFGWNVNASAPAEELQTCTSATGCKKGSEGTGLGQFGARMVGGIAIDPAGNVYVGDIWNSRVQKFNSAGQFLLSFGSFGTGDGQFRTLTFGGYVAVSPDGAEVYVGDDDRIQVFEPDGDFKAQFSFESLHEDSSQFPESGSVKEIAIDPESGDLYVAAVEPPEAPVSRIFRLDPESGELAGSITAPFLNRPTALAVDLDSHLYVVNEQPVGFPVDYKEIMKFDGSGNKLLPTAAEEEEAKEIREDQEIGVPTEPWTPFGMPSDGTGLLALATNGACGAESDNIYVAHYNSNLNLSYVQAYGPPPQDTVKCPPPSPLGPPEIASRYATDVDTDSATLRAEINPRYALDATYYLEYGTGKCSEGACTEEQPVAPGESLTTKVANAPVKTAPVSLLDLEAGTTYHYRFVTQSGAGGPIRSAEGSFTTFPPAPAPFTACANQAFRTGPSALLSDCRAYELVSPAERSPAGDIVASVNGLSYPAELNQSSLDGEKLAYSSEYAFADSLGAPYTSEYIATRIPGREWSTHAISPPRDSTLINKNPNIKLDIEEKAFTADLCRGWLMHNTEPVLDPLVPPGFPRLYRRENCGPEADTYVGLESNVVPVTTTTNYWPELQGFSADGSSAVLRVAAKLTEDAPDLGTAYQIRPSSQIYHWSEDGALRFICYLPNGTQYADTCSVGNRQAENSEARRNIVENAVSENGKRVYWSAGGLETVPGTLYLRENAGEEQSAMEAGKCSEEDQACTYAVSSGTAKFWTAAADGSKALYTQSGALREYDAEIRKSKTVAQDALGVAGASEDLSRFYFASSKALGGEGVEGQPNLYLSEEGQIALVATLSQRDTSGLTRYLPINPVLSELIGRGARATPDGRHLLFASSASLTGYDNLEATSGEPVFELYLYEVGSAGPVCVSCNPSGARPRGRPISGQGEGFSTQMAAKFAAAPNQLYAPRVISSDGSRVFFESFESLVTRDANEAADVYQWQKAGGEADCEAIGADLYVPDSGGCLSLISSGQSDFDSSFVDSSQDGRDVFFKTDSSLVPQDHGLIDVYDAREGGGLPIPPAPSPGCEGEACQSPPPPPPSPAPPASAGFQGPANVKQATPKPKPCPKGKRRVVRGGKVRCVPKKKRRAGGDRGSNPGRGRAER